MRHIAFDPPYLARLDSPFLAQFFGAVDFRAWVIWYIYGDVIARDEFGDGSCRAVQRFDELIVESGIDEQIRIPVRERIPVPFAHRSGVQQKHHLLPLALSERAV